MPIRRHINERAFTPEQVGRLIAAYEDALTALHISDRTDQVKEQIAREIIEIADDDPDCTAAALRARALAALRLADA